MKGSEQGHAKNIDVSDFQLVDLALFVVLELAHIFFEFLNFRFGSLLLFLCGLNIILKLNRGLFVRFDLNTELDVMH